MLHIALQIGFSGDSVRIGIDGREVYRKDGVTTAAQAGIADTIETTVETGHRVVSVSVLSRGVSSEIPLTIAGPTYLGILLSGREITHQISDQPFAYM